jgi:hypothetical protein
MATKLTSLTHKIAVKLHLMEESYTICSSRSRRSVRKLLATSSYVSSLPFEVSSSSTEILAVSIYLPFTWETILAAPQNTVLTEDMS